MAELQPASQESERVGPGITLGVTGWTLVFSVILCVVATLMLTARSRTLAPASGRGSQSRPEPEVSNVRSELFRNPAAGEQLKAAQRARLAQYGWVDQARGIVRVPVDVALELELQAAQQRPRP